MASIYGKTISIYAAALVITVIGAGATMLILNAASFVPDIGFVDPDLVLPSSE
jgi:hypothetical protein